MTSTNQPTDLVDLLTPSVRRRLNPKVAQLAVRQSLFIALIIEIVVFGIGSPHFFTLPNFTTIAIQSSIIGIVSVAFGMLLITGYIDLSVGSVLALSAVVAGRLLADNVNAGLAVLAALAVGAVIGAINGFLTAVIGFSPIIVTLGLLTAVRGIAIGLSAMTPAGFADGFVRIGSGTFGLLPIPIWLLLIAFLAGGYVLKFTALGRHIFAVGVNREAAFLSGISVRSIPFGLCVVVGIAAAIGGVITAARIDAAPGGTIGVGFELSVLTAVLLGGVAFGGGRGGIFGIFLGVAFMAILQNGLTILNVSNTMQQLIEGLVLIAAAALEWVSARSSRS